MPGRKKDAFKNINAKTDSFHVILMLKLFSLIIPIVYTFNEVADESAQVVGLFLLALAHLHHVGQILTDLLQHLAAHLHLTLEEAEQWILVLCNDELKRITETDAPMTRENCDTYLFHVTSEDFIRCENLAYCLRQLDSLKLMLCKFSYQPPFSPICFGPHLDVLHCALKRIDRLWHELQPVASCGVERPHPGRLSVGRGRCVLLLLRLVGKVVLILQHLHFQHLTHHVKACAARRREQSEQGEGGAKTRPWWEVGRKKKSIVEQRNTQLTTRLSLRQVGFTTTNKKGTTLGRNTTIQNKRHIQKSVESGYCILDWQCLKRKLTYV